MLCCEYRENIMPRNQPITKQDTEGINLYSHTKFQTCTYFMLVLLLRWVFVVGSPLHHCVAHYLCVSSNRSISLQSVCTLPTQLYVKQRTNAIDGCKIPIKIGTVQFFFVAIANNGISINYCGNLKKYTYTFEVYISCARCE